VRQNRGVQVIEPLFRVLQGPLMSCYQRFEVFALNHSASFDHRRLPEALRTAMTTAFFCPTKTTSRLPLVTPV
jgi:hypothetical protein